MAALSEHERITNLEQAFSQLEASIAGLRQTTPQLLSPPVQWTYCPIPISFPPFLPAPVPPVAAPTVNLGNCEFAVIHASNQSEIQVVLTRGTGELEVNGTIIGALPPGQPVIATGNVRVHGTGEGGAFSWTPVRR